MNRVRRMMEMVKMAVETARMVLELVPGTATEMEKAMDRATVQDTVRPEAKREEFARLHKFCTNYLSDLLVDFVL